MFTDVVSQVWNVFWMRFFIEIKFGLVKSGSGDLQIWTACMNLDNKR
jgi:hypothetical protein